MLPKQSQTTAMVDCGLNKAKHLTTPPNIDAKAE